MDTIKEVAGWKDGTPVHISGVVSYAQEPKTLQGKNGEFTTQGFALKDDTGSIWVDWANPSRPVADGETVELRSEGRRGSYLDSYEKDGERKLKVRVSGRWLRLGEVGTGAKTQEKKKSTPNGKIDLWEVADLVADLYEHFVRREMPAPEAQRAAVSCLIAAGDGKVEWPRDEPRGRSAAPSHTEPPVEAYDEDAAETEQDDDIPF